ncbi:uncharacterized protein LOC134249643 [Saccostrea cucullata]|uniref:uncharacterized protein LOC134249643 n=1 Tax=Saccostrea cuccullata TaxID=36930 RepID=UPI002ED35017
MYDESGCDHLRHSPMSLLMTNRRNGDGRMERLIFTDSSQNKAKESVQNWKEERRLWNILSYLEESWTPTSKKNLTECLQLDINSPEKTDDENSTKWVRLPFSWKTTRLCKGKEALDKAYRHKVLKTESADASWYL